MIDDATLLRRYATARCGEAFAELVRRHLPLVYSGAVRRRNIFRQPQQQPVKGAGCAAGVARARFEQDRRDFGGAERAGNAVGELNARVRQNHA